MRHGWRLIAGALAALLAVRLLYLLPLPYQPVRDAADVLYALFYLLLVFTVRATPGAHAAEEVGVRRVERAASVLFVAALFTYFVAIPRLFAPELYATWAPSLLCYATLDGFLVVCLVRRVETASRARWRWVYGIFAVAAGIWLVTDLYEGATYLGRTLWFDEASVLNAVWFLPLTLAAIAARVSRRRLPAWMERSGTAAPPRPFRSARRDHRRLRPDLPSPPPGGQPHRRPRRRAPAPPARRWSRCSPSSSSCCSPTCASACTARTSSASAS